MCEDKGYALVVCDSYFEIFLFPILLCFLHDSLKNGKDQKDMLL